MKYKIAVSGAAQTGICSKNAEKLAKEIGKEIAKQGCILVTGATTGIPYFSVQGLEEAGGVSVGFSPAASETAHRKKYRLPRVSDIIVHTGFGYAGRNLLMTRAADAVIIICGRMGTLNEFTIAFEDQKPIGVLEGTGGTADIIKDLIKFPHRGKTRIVFEKDPKKLVEKLIRLIKDSKRSKR